MKGLGTCLVVVLAAGCGGSDPTDVTYGETTFVVVLNPPVNDANDVQVPVPGAARAGVSLATDDQVADTTDGAGVAVLAGVGAGTRTIAFSGAEVDVALALSIEARDLREVAIVADGATAASMSQVVFEFGGDVVEVTPEMSNAAVNQALADSGTIVFFSEGTYSGDLEFAGSNVTLFGEGPLGGRVRLEGNVTIAGSGNRVRGATISGTLDVPGSDVSVSFSRVEGATTVDGSGAVLLANDFCGPVSIVGSGGTVLDNRGLAPLAEPGDC